MKSVVIIGGGFAGLAAAGKLRRAFRDVSITLIDRRRAFNFLPALPDAVNGRIPPEILEYPLPGLCGRWGIDLVGEAATEIIPEQNIARTAGRAIPYDALLLACGSETNFHGLGWAEKTALKLDDCADARRLAGALRSGAYEHYVVAGGGYTGIEIAAGLRRYLLQHHTPKPVTIVEPAGSILSGLPETLRAYVSANLRTLGIETRLKTVIVGAEPGRVRLSDGTVLNGCLLVWAAGVAVPALLKRAGLPATSQNRVIVDTHLRFSGNCFAAGDAAAFFQGDRPLRMSVQFAIEQGGLAAENIGRLLRGRPLLKYRPFDPGYIVPMANNRSCGIVLGKPIYGRLPTALHYLMCSYRMPGPANKLRIFPRIFA